MTMTHSDSATVPAVVQEFSGFTLIELLVVITIIVVLLALLTPALDKAIYQAELAVCGASQHGVVSGVQSYAVSFKRRYPYRPTVSGQSTAEPARIKQAALADTPPFNPNDDRGVVQEYFSTRSLLDPLVEEVDLSIGADDRDTAVFSTYTLWFGFQYNTSEGIASGMFRLGDRFGYAGDRFNVLVSDDDTFSPTDDLSFSSHPDADGFLAAHRLENQEASAAFEGTGRFKQTRSRFASNTGITRGLVDLNVGLDDGSVRRYNGVSWEEGQVAESRVSTRMARVPQWNDGPGFPGTGGENWIRLPRFGR